MLFYAYVCVCVYVIATKFVATLRSLLSVPAIVTSGQEEVIGRRQQPSVTKMMVVASSSSSSANPKSNIAPCWCYGNVITHREACV